MNFLYGPSMFLMRGTLKIFADEWNIEGIENVPRDGPLMVVGNHLSNMDPPLLSASFPRKIQFMAKQSLFANPIARIFFKGYGAFPIAETGKEFSSIQRSLSILQKNGVMGIFPEGGRNPEGLGKAMLGVGMIAIKSGAPILPIGITGTEKLGHWLRVCYPKGNFTIKIGAPFSINVEGNQLRKNIESATDTIMAHIAELLPSEYRGVYANDWNGERSYTSPKKFGF